MVSFAAPITIRVATTDIIRTDIGQATFGSGVEFRTSELRWTASTPTLGDTTALTADTMKWLKLGSLRFPNGTSSLHYAAEQPEWSYYECPNPPKAASDQCPNPAATCSCTHYGNQWDSFLTPTEITSFTDNRFDMQRLFQVNTWLSAKGKSWFDFVQDSNGGLNATALDAAARKASAWVARDGGRTRYWEIGNEDWARWNATQHAQIAEAFRSKMLDPNLNGGRKPLLMVQGLAADYNGNKPADWYAALTSKLPQDSSRKISSIYGYSVHQYITAKDYPDALSEEERRRNQTSDMFATVEANRPVNGVKTILGIGTANSPTRDWKVWMTEFNVDQPAAKDSRGAAIPETLQDVGHALVIADWTGKMLESNVERLFMHSLDHHQDYALVQYANDGSKINSPVVTAPGFAYAIYPQEFGQTMVRTLYANNPSIPSADKHSSYPQVSAYSSIKDGKELRIIVVNRSLQNKAYVNINTATAPGQRWLASGKFGFRELRSRTNTIHESNRISRGYTKDNISWSPVAQYNQYVTGIENVELAPASANLFIMPLQVP